MSLNTPQLKTGIIEILTDMSTRKETSIEEFAERLSTKLETYVKTGKIVYTSGLVAPSTGGAVTGTFNGSIE